LAGKWLASKPFSVQVPELTIKKSARWHTQQFCLGDFLLKNNMAAPTESCTYSLFLSLAFNNSSKTFNLTDAINHLS